MILYISLILLIVAVAVLVCLIIRLYSGWSKLNSYVDEIVKTVDSVRYGNLTNKIYGSEKKKHYKKLTDSINRMIEALYDRERMIAEYQSEMLNQNKFLESVVNSLSDGIIVVDKDGKIINTTPNIKSWFGCDDIQGKSIFEYVNFENSQNFDSITSEEICIKNSADGNYIITSQKLDMEDKIFYILVVKDVTKEHEIETLKEDFVATLTHDLKVPIVAESNMIEFFLEGKFGEINDKQQIALKNMQSSNKELLDLVQIVLETYKLNEKGILLFKERTNLNEFINNIVKDMQTIADKSDITIYFEADCEVYAQIDVIQMTRVIKNLVSNAISHSNTKEKIVISMKKNADVVEIVVTDFGQGISKDEMDLIFNRYYSAANKFRKIGTGLGLYLARQIVLSHGGEITVNSEENRKTEFIIKLPV